MGEHTGISWTDHTFNPWWGCTKVSPGCDHCYADAFDRRVHGAHIVQISPAQMQRLDLDEPRELEGLHWGPNAPRRVFGDKHWNEPLKWNREAVNKFHRRARVFCASMADIMDEEAPAGLRERLWDLINRTPNLMWQLLTKRPQNYERFLPASFPNGNVMLGFTAEDQPYYNARFAITREAARQRDLLWWVSYEPALGPLKVECLMCYANLLHSPDCCDIPDWIIFGGESGVQRRDCQQGWAETLKTLCEQYGIAYFVKQMSAKTPDQGKALIPQHLMIQQFPQGA